MEKEQSQEFTWRKLERQRDCFIQQRHYLQHGDTILIKLLKLKKWRMDGEYSLCRNLRCTYVHPRPLTKQSSLISKTQTTFCSLLFAGFLQCISDRRIQQTEMVELKSVARPRVEALEEEIVAFFLELSQEGEKKPFEANSVPVNN